MKTLTLSTLILFFLSILSTAVHAQNVTIPDANFKAYLIGNTSINTNGDAEIQVSEANAFGGIIDCHFMFISDLTGIEAFINIINLDCSSNQLTNLDVATNTALTHLNCHDNRLTNLDVTTNTALTYLKCYDNQLTNLDVTTNTALTYLDCYNNQLTNLDVATGTALTYLDCYSNQLTNLDVATNTALTHLKCYYNQLTNLDVATNTALTYLDCTENPLTNLDVATNTALTYLSCSKNQLTNLDVATNTALVRLYCSKNQLTNLNVANGNNSSFTQFDATDNPNLSCIQVDDVAYSTTNWISIAATASFSTFCPPVSINKLEDNKLTNVQVYPNPTSKNVSIDLNKNYKEITILITNTIGQVVLSKQYTAQQFINLDLEGNSGVYFVTILTEEGTSKTKVIKA